MVRVSSRIVRVMANVLSLCHGSMLQTTYRRKSRRLDQYEMVKCRSKERIQQVLQDGTFCFLHSLFHRQTIEHHFFQICRKIGVLKPQEEFDGDTTKTKIVFVTVQFLYTILTYVVFERGVREYFSLMFIQSCHSPQHSFRTRIVTTQPRNTLLLGKP